MGIQKQGMHVDEYLTYGLSNQTNQATIAICFEDMVSQSPVKVFEDYFYSDEFDIAAVWNNQRQDVHPPFYYLLFHIFGVTLKNCFGLKTGILLNILFHICNIFILYRLIWVLVKKEDIALLGAAFYALAPIVQGNVLFIRMYVLLALCILSLTYFFVKNWNIELDRKHYAELGIICIVGMLTHYYFYIYLCYACSIWIIHLWMRWKSRYKVIEFVVAIAIYMGSSIIIFPYMLQHVFVGYRGKGTVEQLLHAPYFSNLKFYCNVINQEFGGILVAILLAFIIGALYYRARHGKVIEVKQCFACIYQNAWSMVVFPCVLYFLTVSKIAVMLESRYISPLYSIVVVILLGAYRAIVTKCLSEKCQRIVGSTVLLIVLVISWRQYAWPELHTELSEGVEVAREYSKTNNCIYVYKDSWMSLPVYPELIEYQNVTFLHVDTLEEYFEIADLVDEHFVIYFTQNIDKEIVEDTLSEFNKWNKIYESEYNDVFCVQ